MLQRFNLGYLSFLAMGAVAILALTTLQQAGAATMGPATFQQPVESTASSPVHCRKYRHYHKRCRYCQRFYHTCSKR